LSHPIRSSRQLLENSILEVRIGFSPLLTDCGLKEGDRLGDGEVGLGDDGGLWALLSLDAQQGGITLSELGAQPVDHPRDVGSGVLCSREAHDLGGPEALGRDGKGCHAPEVKANHL
jgi:hypothetical protein